MASTALSLYSIGNQLEDVCHKTFFVKKIGFNLFSSYSDETRELLMLRTKCKNIYDVCYHHEKIYLSKYTYLYGKKCCDPLKRKCSTRKSLRTITLERARNSFEKLISGKKFVDSVKN